MSSVSRSGSQPVRGHLGVPAWLILRVWLTLGLQSFGGGSATLYMIRRAVVVRYNWLSDEEFTRDWAISQIVPGINLLSLTTLIGWRTRGLLGIPLALTGLLLPSVSITILLTALYARFKDLNAMQAALSGIIPATVGLGLLLAFQMGRPLLLASHRQSRPALLIALLILLGSAALMAYFRLPVIVILLGGGAVGALGAFLHSLAQRGQP